MLANSKGSRETQLVFSIQHLAELNVRETRWAN